MPPLPDAARIVSRELENGSSIRSAMMAGGYTEYQANRGKAGIPAKIWRELSGTAKEMIRIGAQLNASDQENLVRGRLAINTIRGKDGGVMSAKALGSDRRVNMFAAETLNQNLIIMPSAIPGQSTTPQLAAPVSEPPAALNTQPASSDLNTAKQEGK